MAQPSIAPLTTTALSLYREGSFSQALATLEPLLQAAAVHPEVLNLAAVCLRRLGRAEEAEAHLQRLVEECPEHVDAHCNLGNVLKDLQRFAQAEAAYRRGLAVQPDHVETLNNLGDLFHRTERLVEAEAALRHALMERPDHVAAWDSLGLVLYALQRFAEAEAAFRRVLALAPEHAETCYSLGYLLHSLKRVPEAEALYQRALALRPDLIKARVNLGVLFHETKRPAQAEVAYRQALALCPDEINALNNLGAILMDGGFPSEGLAFFRRAIESDPDLHAARHGNLVYRLTFAAEDGQVVLDECRHWSARHEAPLRAQRQPHDNDRSPERRLRIGYVSPDFRSHCQSLFTLPVFAHHDHTPFEFFFYSSVATPDRLTERLKAMADVWRDVHALDDGQLAQLIREDRIDVLVDLTMHMANGRPLVFARKPAPVQVAWLAYPGTTGIEAMDYRLTDPYIDPPGSDAQYSERSIRLPDTFWCYDPSSMCESPAVNSLPALTIGHLTFGSLNNPGKLTDHTLRLWAAVLRRFPQAHLLLLTHSDPPSERFTQRFEALGIDLRQVRFAAFRPYEDYLRLYHEIDIGLDTFPYNGHTTSLDSFWMGVPVVTRIGNTAVGRAGLSLLTNLGLEDWSASSDEEFVETTVRQAQDLPRLAQLRQSLRSRMAQSPLMDGARFARHLEGVYRQVWREWCR